MRGHVRLAASASAIAEALLDDVAAFMRAPENRNVKVDIEESLSKDLVQVVRDGRAALGVCWDSVDFEALQHRPYRRDQLALAVHADHPLAGRARLSFEQTLDYEHVGLQSSTAVHTMLRRAAAQSGRDLVYRVVVSNFDAAFRVVGANLGVSVVPMQVGEAYSRLLNLKIIPLTDDWARRQFAICFRDAGALQPAAARMLEHLIAQARI
jgi:DNA-binding transcriptional LysR family regulator